MNKLAIKSVRIPFYQQHRQYCYKIVDRSILSSALPKRMAHFTVKEGAQTTKTKRRDCQRRWEGHARELWASTWGKLRVSFFISILAKFLFSHSPNSTSQLTGPILTPQLTQIKGCYSLRLICHVHIVTRHPVAIQSHFSSTYSCKSVEVLICFD